MMQGTLYDEDVIKKMWRKYMGRLLNVYNDCDREVAYPNVRGKDGKSSRPYRCSEWDDKCIRWF